MAAIRNARQAVTPKGTERRVADMKFGLVSDPRKQGKVTFAVAVLLRLCVMAMLSGARSLRDIESRSEQLRPSRREFVGLAEDERVSDNAIGELLPRLSPEELRWSLHSQVKGEWYRDRLAPTQLGLSTVAIDGKHQATLRWWKLSDLTKNVLQAVGDERAQDDSWHPSEDDVRSVFSTRFPWVQLCKQEDKPMYGLVRALRSTLVSSKAAVCLDLHPILGTSNEMATIESCIDELLHVYGRTGMIRRVTTDAGNTSLRMATKLHAADIAYFLAIKSPQGDIYAEAVRLLGSDERRPDYSVSEERSGRTVAYDVWIEPLPAGFLGWTHARQLVRVRRVTAGDAPDDKTTGDRYYVSSETPEQLGAKEAQVLSRMHWRCENEGHWTSNTMFKEAARRAPLSRHPVGVLVGTLVRMLAQNVLAVMRALSLLRTDAKKKLVKPTWRAVMDHFLSLLFEPLLPAPAFDA